MAGRHGPAETPALGGTCAILLIGTGERRLQICNLPFGFYFAAPASITTVSMTHCGPIHPRSPSS